MIPVSFLNDIAQFINNETFKIILNSGEYEITNFDSKTVEDNLLTINYTVPNGAVGVVERIELRKSNNEVISDNTVYVPITADSIFKQTFRVTEVV